jgi:intraflagellar transport protein 81
VNASLNVTIDTNEIK